MSKRCLAAIFLVLFLVMGRVSEASVYSVKINVTSANAATNYPVLVNLDSRTLINMSGSSYPDMRGLRFTNASGAQLNFFIPPTKHALRAIENLPVWVQV